MARAGAADAIKAAIHNIGQGAAESIPRAPRVQPARTFGELRDRLGGTKAVAGALGVSQRTVERYISREEGKGSQQRSPGRTKGGESIADKFRDFAKNQADTVNRENRNERAKAQRQARKEAQAQAVKNGAKPRIEGIQGPAKGDSTYLRNRTVGPVAPGFSGIVMEQLIELADSGDDEALVTTFQEAFAPIYGGNAWVMEDVEIDFSF